MKHGLYVVCTLCLAIVGCATREEASRAVTSGTDFTAKELAMFKAFRLGTAEERWTLLDAVHKALPTVQTNSKWVSLPKPDPNVTPVKTMSEAEVIRLLGEPNGGRHTHGEVTTLDYAVRPADVQRTLRIMVYRDRAYGRVILISI